MSKSERVKEQDGTRERKNKVADGIQRQLINKKRKGGRKKEQKKEGKKERTGLAALASSTRYRL